MNSFVRVVPFAVLTLSVACATSDVPTQPLGPIVSMVRLRVEPYSFTYYSGLDRPARLVVRDAFTWQNVWSEIHRRQSPVPSLPAIDFSREAIVVVALGARSSGGYGILLAGAAESGANEIAVTVHSTSPGPNCVTTQAFTQPVDIARLPLRGGTVRFLERNEVSDCR